MTIHDDLNEIVYGNGRPADMPFNTTDVGNGQRLVAHHGDDLRYVGPWRRWLSYDGSRWTIDDTGEVERRAKDTARSIYGEAERASSSDLRKELGRHAMRSEAMNRIDAMIKAARSEPSIPIRPDDLDADPWLFNVENGTINLKTGELKEHRREDLASKVAPVAYNPDAKAPTWEAFLERVLPSEELRRFVRRAVGYSLTGDVSEQVLFFLHGSGANGKSTLINAVRAITGDYGQQAAPELLEAKRGSHPTELADLKGARFVASVEVAEGQYLAENLVKQMTGGDPIKARFMRQDFFEFLPTHKTFLAANHKPEIKGTDYAIWRRIKMVPFEVTISEEEQDPKLPEKLKAELPGILAWAVRGCLDWQKHGLGEPDEVREATAGYRAEMDKLAAFIEECCVVYPDAKVGATPLYESYKAWCARSGENPETQTSFGTRIRERGFTDDRDPKTRRKIWLGIGLFTDQDPDGSGGCSGGSTTEDAKQLPGAKQSETDNRHDPTRKDFSSDHAEKGFRSVSEAPTVSDAGDPVRELLEDPPEWFQRQAAVCVREGVPERLLAPLASAVAYECFGDAHRWREVRPIIEDRIKGAVRITVGGSAKEGGRRGLG